MAGGNCELHSCSVPCFPAFFGSPLCCRLRCIARSQHRRGRYLCLSPGSSGEPHRRLERPHASSVPFRVSIDDKEHRRELHRLTSTQLASMAYTVLVGGSP